MFVGGIFSQPRARPLRRLLEASEKLKAKSAIGSDFRIVGIELVGFEKQFAGSLVIAEPLVGEADIGASARTYRCRTVCGQFCFEVLEQAERGVRFAAVEDVAIPIDLEIEVNIQFTAAASIDGRHRSQDALLHLEPAIDGCFRMAMALERFLSQGHNPIGRCAVTGIERIERRLMRANFRLERVPSPDLDVDSAAERRLLLRQRVCNAIVFEIVVRGGGDDEFGQRRSDLQGFGEVGADDLLGELSATRDELALDTDQLRGIAVAPAGQIDPRLGFAPRADELDVRVIQDAAEQRHTVFLEGLVVRWHLDDCRGGHRG